ncbi:Uma2 family endonuclease [Limnoraphis robusta Tam1]|uniref:Uma2 family endonuclease n=1 Tax=Limnoraphis robusta CCNP1315 TaxID=3110306 RepID=A0ABU5U789_9CYAN|nr:Uma2 family endonuclease [Limnoraphis robusta]MEA5500109.1 Uma2 family endonuclease [Limnoraphis robusta BA-68 BA1]MEA5522741.1 Uma2 family endonuclease [Limnoraphis robusta CCNP1315]MEA5540226.1 Uma2 family endonuclease [Limnoraphis robusta Tam1]MEA5543801.1 Uma2 family endonuclease [Limnoraphis robusta CCNP1324]
MIAHSQSQFMTAKEYLEWEEKQPIKYEYINGQVFAMTGGSLPHNSIALNLASALKSHLRGKGCKVFMADAKVGVSSNGPFHYPDIMVTCDSRDQTARQVIYYPCLIVEVLSPSTEGFDRGKKFRHYRKIETLKEYVLVDTEKMNIECYRLNEQNKWELTSYSPEELAINQTELEINLTSVNFNSPISLIYEDVVFPDENLEDLVLS